MILSPSQEFLALCQAQISLLTRSLGATASSVYLADPEERQILDPLPKLVQVAAYPSEDSVDLRPSFQPRRSLRGQSVSDGASKSETPPAPRSDPAEAQDRLALESSSLSWQGKLVLPLVHQAEVLGFLVTGREGQPWSEPERLQIEQVACSLALACVLDRRALWLDVVRQQQGEAEATLLHQLRNPLTALRTFAKLVLRRLQPSDVNRSPVNSILRESDHIQELLVQFESAMLPTASANLLEPAPDSDSERLALPPAAALPLETLTLASVVLPLLESAAAVAQERGLQLNIDWDPRLPTVRANGHALREVLGNLLDNALKYTPAGGQVRVSGTGDSVAGVTLTVADTGPGIPPDDLQHVFERHYRGVQQSGEIEGTGLGLAIALDLSNRMGSNLQVGSHLGEGSVFRLWLPAAV